MSVQLKVVCLLCRYHLKFEIISSFTTYSQRFTNWRPDQAELNGFPGPYEHPGRAPTSKYGSQGGWTYTSKVILVHDPRIYQDGQQH